MQSVNGTSMPLWVLVIAFIGCLFILFMRKRKKFSTGSLRNVAMLLQRDEIDLSNRDIINNQFIGIDTRKKMLVLSHLDYAEEPVRTIMLTDIVFCRMIKKYKEIPHQTREKSNEEKELDLISLVFYSGAKYPAAEFIFYDGSLNTTDEIPGMKKKAEYWTDLIAKTGSVDIL